LSSSPTEHLRDGSPEDVPTVDVTMPETGSDAGTTVIGWMKEPGQAVEADEPICLVSWDGTTAEIGSPATGVLRMLAVAAGMTVAAGTSLALIDTRLAPEPEPEPAPPPVAVEPDPEPEQVAVEPEAEAAPEPEPEPADEDADEETDESDPVPERLMRDAPVAHAADVDLGAFRSPAVLRLAAEHGIDLEAVPGTGAGGRVTLRDVRAHAQTAATSA